MIATQQRVAGLLLAVCAGYIASCAGEDPERPPIDVLLISLDSVRADDLTFLDPARAPNLTRLAERGTLFTQAIAGSSWTLPTHAELFTGQPPSLHRVETDDVALDPLQPTLPELFRAGGWFTAGFYSGWYLAGEFGFGRGFATYENAIAGGPEFEQAFRAGLDGRQMDEFWKSLSARDKQSHEDVSSERVTELAAGVLDRLDGDERVFFFAHYFDPHYDYVPPGEWATRFDPGYRGPINGRNFWVNPKIWDWSSNRRVVDERGLRHLRSLYRGEIGWTDQWIGELLARFEAAGRTHELLILVTADHGEEFFEHQNRGHKQTLYDEVLRVPLLVVPPPSWGLEPARRVEAQVSMSDVLPTLIDSVGIELPEGVAGRSLLPAVAGRSFDSRPVVSSLELFDSQADGSWKVFQWESLRLPERKLVRILEVDGTGPPTVTSAGLFDLTRDPKELRAVGGSLEVARRNPKFVAAWIELERELARLREIDAGLAHSEPGERATDMARALASELEGLGYVDLENAGDQTASRLLPWGLGMRPPEPLEGR